VYADCCIRSTYIRVPRIRRVKDAVYAGSRVLLMLH